MESFIFEAKKQCKNSDRRYKFRLAGDLLQLDAHQGLIAC